MTTPVLEPTQKKVKQPKAVQEQAVKEPVAEPTVVTEDSVEVVVETEAEAEVDSFESRLDALRASLQLFSVEITEKLKNVKAIEHELKKLSVLAKKEFKKKSKKSKKGISNSGFNAPVLISDELASFLKMPKGSVLRPPQVSSLISKYATEHGLKEETNRAIYKCDNKLKKLFGAAIHPIKKSEPELGNGVSIFNLNSYLKRHFTKIEKQETTSS